MWRLPHACLHLKANVQILRTDSEGAAGAHLRQLTGLVSAIALPPGRHAAVRGPACSPQSPPSPALAHPRHPLRMWLQRCTTSILLQCFVSLITIAYLCPVLRFPSPTRSGDENWAVSLTQGHKPQLLSHFSVPLAADILEGGLSASARGPSSSLARSTAPASPHLPASQLPESSVDQTLHRPSSWSESWASGPLGLWTGRPSQCPPSQGQQPCFLLFLRPSMMESFSNPPYFFSPQMIQEPKTPPHARLPLSHHTVVCSSLRSVPFLVLLPTPGIQMTFGNTVDAMPRACPGSLIP